MRPYTRLTRPEQLGVVAEPHRMAVLKLLMAAPATVSQLGQAFGKHAAWARHHVKALEAAGLAELHEVRTTRNYTEKFYRATAGAFAVDVLLRPEGGPVLALASHDLALEALAEGAPGDALALGVTGSLDALIALRQGAADVAGCHLIDQSTGEYNVPYVRHLFPDRRMLVLTLAHREQGLIVRGSGAVPRDIRDIAGGPRFVNRNRGSGTRLWLDAELERRGISPADVRGYEHEVRTHTEAAAAVAAGRADVAVGLRLAAERLGLGFVPLFMERYDLVMSEDTAADERLAELIDRVSDRAFRRQLGSLAGYDAEHSGEHVSA